MSNKFGEVPNKIKPVLIQKEINPENILVCIPFDRHMDMYPCEGYLFFTDKIFYTVKVRETKSIIKGQTLEFYDFDQYDIDKIKDLDIFSLISGGILIGKYKDETIRFAMYSNSYSKMYYKFKSLLSKVIEGKELTDDDFIFDKAKDICPTCGMPYPDQSRRVCPRCMDKRSLFMRVLGYFKPYKVQFAIIILCILLHSGMNVVMPYLSGTVLYDQIINPQASGNPLFLIRGLDQISALMVLVIVLMLVRIFNQLFGVIQGRIIAGFVPKAVLKIKSDVYNSMQKLSLSFFNKRQTGSLLTRVQNDASEVLSFFIDGLPYLVINIIIVVLSAAIMISLNLYLAIFSLVFIPLLFIMSYSMVPRLWHLHGKRHRSVRNMNAQVQDNLTGARVVKAFGQEETEDIRFEKTSSRVRDAELNEVDYDNKFFGLYNAVQTFSIIVIWGLGSWLVINNPDVMTYGILITFTGYAAMLSGPLDFMSFMFRWWAQSLNSAQRIFEVIDAVPEVSENQNPVRKEKFDGKIQLKNVSFSYDPSKPVLKDISFKINPGEFFGIVGKTGAGKTTIINLISRFYDPLEGEILIDDIPVKDLSFEDLRRNIAVVSQDTYIFKGTIAENIAYAKDNCTNNEILFASMAASAHDFISKLPHGYDTIVGTGGQDLSGGEKQRLSIARAILADPQILILDEATASVDTLTEQRIQKALNYLIKGRTTISIAHRLSTLKNANRMVVIEDNKVVEEGTHEELTDIKGSYYDLMQLQSKALAIRGTDE